MMKFLISDAYELANDNTSAPDLEISFILSQYLPVPIPNVYQDDLIGI